MLHHLHIQNLAIIAKTTIDFNAGLACFTGETGAGKSLVIGALAALFGQSTSTQLLRGGAEQGRVDGLFELTKPSLIQQIEAIADVELDHGELLLSRKMFATGRSRFAINSQPTTAATMRRIGQLLIEIHGQHDHQKLLKPGCQRDLLDRYGECEALRDAFHQTQGQIQKLIATRKQLMASQTLREQQLELYEFQAQEIDAVEPERGEFEKVASQHRRLSNVQEITADATAVHAAIYEADGSIAEQLTGMYAVLNRLAELDDRMEPISQSIKSVMDQMHDAAFELNRYVNRLEVDDGQLATVTERLNMLNRVIHKYGQGGCLEDVIDRREKLGRDIDELNNQAVAFDAIDEQLVPLRSELREIGKKLTAKRTKAAKKLKPLVESQLKSLGMEYAEFETAVETELPDAQSNEGANQATGGFDVIEMRISNNPGQPPRALQKVASGGELSRIILAIRTILAAADDTPLLVFDEIDANIGGRIANVVGEKLRALATGRQVICITHLPQIAAYSDSHFCVGKQSQAGQTQTQVSLLNDEADRIKELVTMFAGSESTDAGEKQASEMLQRAKQKPRSTKQTAGKIGKRPKLKLTA